MHIDNRRKEDALPRVLNILPLKKLKHYTPDAMPRSGGRGCLGKGKNEKSTEADRNRRR